MCRGLILYNLRIETFNLTLLCKREKLKNKHLFLISILDNSPLLSRDNNFSRDCSELSAKFLFITILQFYTSYTRFQLSLSLTFRF